MKRALVLRREALADLSADDLGLVAGGAEYSGQGLSCPLLDCLNYTFPPRCR